MNPRMRMANNKTIHYLLTGAIGLLSGLLGASLIQDKSQHITPITSGGDITYEVLSSHMRQYILENPEIIMESVDKLHQQQKQKNHAQLKNLIKEQHKNLFADKADPRLGNKDAKADIVMFFDYNCGACKQMLAVNKKLAENNKARFILKELPVLGAASELKARYALAVHVLYPYQYANIHQDLFQQKISDDNQMLDLLAKYGVDTSKIKAAAYGKEVEKALDKNQDLARKLGVNGIPTYIIGEDIIPGGVDYEKFVEIIG